MKSSSRITVWLETLGLTLVIPAMGLLLNREDPFFVQSDFPWLWFGPLLAGLRYGMAPALGSVTFLAAFWFAASVPGLVMGGPPLHFMMGGALLVLIAGQFSSIWSTRLRREDQLNRHVEERFEQLSLSYFMVRHSHDRLEQNLISRPITLRQAMIDLRTLLTSVGGKVNRDLARDLVVLLSHYCSLSSASLYEVQNGRVSPEPLATCGQGTPFRRDDLLVRSALESGTAAFQAVNQLSDDQASSYLAVVPLRTSSGRILALLLVNDMPFMALHRETLQILAVLMAYAADQVEAANLAKSILAVYPDCPPLFGAELFKMSRLNRDLDVISILAVITLKPGPERESICLALERQQRGLDHSWRRDRLDDIQFITLLPFSGPAALEGYRSRLNDILKKQFQTSFDNEGISLTYVIMTGEDPLKQLDKLLTEENA